MVKKYEEHDVERADKSRRVLNEIEITIGNNALRYFANELAKTARRLYGFDLPFGKEDGEYRGSYTISYRVTSVKKVKVVDEGRTVYMFGISAKPNAEVRCIVNIPVLKFNHM